jgi:hypothetical protein
MTLIPLPTLTPLTPRRLKILVLLVIVAVVVTLYVLATLYGLVMNYLVAPLKVWRKSRSSVSAAVRVRAESASQEMREAVAALAAEVQPLGFELRAVSEMNGGAATVCHVHNAERGDHLLDYRAEIQGRSLRWQVFVTHFEGGAEVVTSNAPSPSVFSREPDQHVCRLPSDTGLATLHRAHLEHIRTAVRAAEPIRSLGRGSFVERYEQGALEKQHALGLYRREGEVYRPTFRGAFLMTWRLLPPLKGRRESQNERVAAAILGATATPLA